MVFASTYEVLLLGRALVGVGVGIGLAVRVFFAYD
jgi:predicted MFS family arabinose efflux permease